MATTVVGSIEYDASIDTAGFVKDANIVETSAKNLSNNIANNGNKAFASFANSASSAFGGVANGIASLTKVTAAALITGGFGLGTFIKQASELQSVTASFESMTGSAEEAQKVLKQLYKFSFATAFSTADINSAGKAWLASGLAVDDLGKVMQQVGDIAGATGANLGSLTLPLTQALARGKLQTQDYYQILNSGAGKFAQTLQSEVTEHGLGNLQDALSEGTVTAEVLFAALETANQKGQFAFEGAIKQSMTFNGQLSNLMETIGNVGLEILGVDKATGEIDPGGIFAQLSLAVQDATKWLTEHKTEIKAVATFLIDNFIPIISAMAAMFVVAKVAAIGFAIASAVALGTVSLPILAIVAGIMLVVGTLAYLQAKFDIFGKLAVAIGDMFGAVIKSAINAVLKFIGDKINSFIDNINGIIGLLNKIPGVNIGKIGKLSIPQLANGGIVSSPTLAMIGEGRESEAVIPLSKLEGMMNNGMGGATINLNLSGVMTSSPSEERALAKRLIDRLNEELRANGKAQIGIA